MAIDTTTPFPRNAPEVLPVPINTVSATCSPWVDEDAVRGRTPGQAKAKKRRRAARRAARKQARHARARRS